MDDILKYENRDQLYQFLIDDFGLIKIEEGYDPETFGNFYVTLAAKDFLLSYVNDRSFLTINIANNLEPERGFDLSFVRDLMYNPENINSDDKKDNNDRINELNDFLKKDFDRISLLFNNDNYRHTRKKIDELLKRKFRKQNPGLIE